MKIKTVHYSALFNLDNYSNEKIGFTAELQEDETLEQAIEALRQKVRENGGTNAELLYSEMYQNQKKLQDLNRKIQKAIEQWNLTAERSQAWSFAPAVEDAIENIIDQNIQDFTEELVESFMDSCTESTIIISYVF